MEAPDFIHVSYTEPSLLLNVMPPAYLFGFGLMLYLIYKGYHQGRSERKRKANPGLPLPSLAGA